jgi:hypothetical protein
MSELSQSKRTMDSTNRIWTGLVLSLSVVGAVGCMVEEEPYAVEELADDSSSEASPPDGEDALGEEELANAADTHLSDYPTCVPIGSEGNRLCIQYINDNTGVNMWYEKRAGNPVSVRFSYVSGSFGHYDDGWFTAYVRSDAFSYAWNGSNPGSCITGYLHVSDGTSYTTGAHCL